MTDDTFDNLEGGAERLNGTLSETSSLVSGFDSELRRMRTALQVLARTWRHLKKA